MKKPEYILALDEGTSSCRAIIFDKKADVVGIAQQSISLIFPQSNWVEQDPMEILDTQISQAQNVLMDNNIEPSQIKAIGITNQRETLVVWNKQTGKPVCNAIVWKDSRTIDLCNSLIENGHQSDFRESTGLIIDSYFSATKLNWILNNVPGVKEAAEQGEVICGTIDTWLIWNLTGGKHHLTDYSNASRTMMFNINTLQWDKNILKLLNIPQSMLAEVKNSSDSFGHTKASYFDGVEIPIMGVAGDQQAALFGQNCFDQGTAKNTYGTGSFILMNTGPKKSVSRYGLLTTIAWGLNNQITYALEGSIFSVGDSIQWLYEKMKLINSEAETSEIAKKIETTDGVYIIPAFSGLGAPYWDRTAQGIITGIKQTTGKAEIVRATLEAIAYQTKDVLESMVLDSNIQLKMLKADGGVSVNDFLMQFQSDMLNIQLERPENTETTALGAAFFAGLHCSFWTMKELSSLNTKSAVFFPDMDESKRIKLYAGWKKAVNKAMESNR